MRLFNAVLRRIPRRGLPPPPAAPSGSLTRADGGPARRPTGEARSRWTAACDGRRRPFVKDERTVLRLRENAVERHDVQVHEAPIISALHVTDGGTLPRILAIHLEDDYRELERPSRLDAEFMTRSNLEPIALDVKDFEPIEMDQGLEAVFSRGNWD
jgi:hypothetical protein